MQHVINAIYTPSTVSSPLPVTVCVVLVDTCNHRLYVVHGLQLNRSRSMPVSVVPVSNTENAISISAGRGFTAELKCAHVGSAVRQLKFLGCEICLCWSRVEFLIQTDAMQ